MRATDLSRRQARHGHRTIQQPRMIPENPLPLKTPEYFSELLYYFQWNLIFCVDLDIADDVIII